MVTGEEGYLNILRNRWPDTLWSSWHGFLSWSPVAYMATIGTAAYFARRRWWSVTALTILFLMALLNGSTTDWAAGWSFGGRRFVSCMVLLAPGLALTIEALARRPLVAVGLVALGFVAWNQLLVAQYRIGMLRAGEVVSFGQIVRQQGELATRSPFFYPFAFPANAWFGWRNGLPIERYDLLGPEPLRPSLEIVFDASSNKYMMDGWGPRAGDEWGELRWIDGATAELAAPLESRRERAYRPANRMAGAAGGPSVGRRRDRVRQRREARDRVSRTRRTGRVVLGIARPSRLATRLQSDCARKAQRLAAGRGLSTSGAAGAIGAPGAMGAVRCTAATGALVNLCTAPNLSHPSHPSYPCT